MKSIIALGLGLAVSIATLSQENGKGKNHDIKQHEKIIWAGTGIDLNDKAKDAKKVPDAVMNSFRQYFPDQPIDNVLKYHGLYAITFSNAVYTTTLIYKADGTFVEARTVATESSLPEPIKASAKKSRPGYATNDVVMIEKANKQKFYRLHFKKDNRDEYAVYDESGQEVEYDY